MSIVLQNFVQVSQGARVKPMQPLIPGGVSLMDDDGFVVQLSWMQIADQSSRRWSCSPCSPGW